MPKVRIRSEEKVLYGNWAEKTKKEIFRWWRASILVLKEAGGTTKNLLENFVWNNDSPHTLSEVELQLIKRGLDRLTLLYNEAPADKNLP